MNTKIIQFTAAKGPAECAWVVAKVLKEFIKELQKHTIEYTIVSKQNGIENGTVQSVTIQLKGKDLHRVLKDWLGTIQWIGTSTFRKFHKRKNWFIGCFELQDVKQTALNEIDIKYQAIRSSGPGGQHVNKVSSAIRATHLPTGIQVVVSDTRSQHQNKKLAKERLQAKIASYNTEQLTEQVEEKWHNHLNLQRGNPVKVFKGTDFKRQTSVKNYKKKRQQLKSDLQKKLKN